MKQNFNQLNQSHIEGGKFLNQLRPNFKNYPSVNHAAEIAERHDIQTGNAERKIGTYLMKYEMASRNLSNNLNLTQEDGLSYEIDNNSKEESLEARERSHKRLNRKITESLVMDTDNITESYWQLQREAHWGKNASFGYGNSYQKTLAKQIEMEQRQTAEEWVDYINGVDSPYPTWFKVYALDGLRNMGVYDGVKQTFDRRTKSTTASYPEPNPNAIAQVLDAITLPQSDDNVAELVKRGVFGDLYGYFLNESNSGQSIKAPENESDVHGTWIEYGINDVEALTAAAKGTPWCIAGRKVAESYLTDESDRFYLFHLTNPQTSEPNPIANASIYVNQDSINEVSGIAGGKSQILEPSLVQHVLDKVRDLPGGDEYLENHAKDQQIRSIHQKWKSGTPITEQEARFVFDLNLDSSEVAEQPVTGSARANDLRKILIDNLPDSIDFTAEQLSHFLDEVIGQTEPDLLAEMSASLIKAGANIDTDKLMAELDNVDIINALPSLQELNIIPDIDEFTKSLDGYITELFTPVLLERGASTDAILEVFNRQDEDALGIIKNASVLTEYGANLDLYSAIDKMVSSGYACDIRHCLQELIDAKVDMNYVASHMPPEDVAAHFKQLVKNGAQLDWEDYAAYLD